MDKVQQTQEKEQQWLIETVIKPQLPQLLETLVVCSEQLTSKTPVKLPITSARTEHIKGVLTRVGLDIADMQIVLDMPSLGKRIGLQLRRKVILQQLQRLLDLIEQLTQDVIYLQHHLENHLEVGAFHEKLHSILQVLIQCNNIINKPGEDLLFPKHYVKLSEVFESPINIDDYQDKITIDFFLLNGELSIECKSLHKITHPPWNTVTNGNSHIDQMRDDLKHHKTTVNEIIDKYSDTSLTLKHALGFHKFNINDYLTRGVTFHDIVVIELENSLVHCQDPNLLSISTKIKWLEHQVSKMYKNLNITLI